MTSTGDSLDLLINTEREGQKKYLEMESESLLSNIRYFLRTFAAARGAFADELEKLKRGERDDLKMVGDFKQDIHASDHLILSESPDLSSISSVLLFIATQENATFDLYREISKNISGPESSYFEKIMEQREQVKIRADRLYNDLIQAY